MSWSSLGPGLPHPEDLDQPAEHICEGCGREVFYEGENYEPKAIFVEDLPYCSRECAMLDETEDYEPMGVA